MLISVSFCLLLSTLSSIIMPVLLTTPIPFCPVSNVACKFRFLFLSSTSSPFTSFCHFFLLMFYLILLSRHIVSVCLYFCLELYFLKTFPPNLLSWLKLQWHPSSVQRPCFSSRRFSCAIFSCCLPSVFLFSFHTVPALVPFLVQFVFDWSEFFSGHTICVRILCWEGVGAFFRPKGIFPAVPWDCRGSWVPHEQTPTPFSWQKCDPSAFLSPILPTDCFLQLRSTCPSVDNF